MAKPSRAKDSSDDSMSSSSTEEEAVKDQLNEEEDEEELEAVARTADDSDDEDDEASNAVAQDDDDIEEDDAIANGIAKRERARLKEMQKMKKQKIQEILDVQNAAIDADMNNKGKGRLNYLLQQTELFAHFAKGDQSVSQKKAKGRFMRVVEKQCEEDAFSGESRSKESRI